jgi:hypothetical protein
VSLVIAGAERIGAECAGFASIELATPEDLDKYGIALALAAEDWTYMWRRAADRIAEAPLRWQVLDCFMAAGDRYARAGGYVREHLDRPVVTRRW